MTKNSKPESAYVRSVRERVQAEEEQLAGFRFAEEELILHPRDLEEGFEVLPEKPTVPKRYIAQNVQEPIVYVKSAEETEQLVQEGARISEESQAAYELKQKNKIQTYFDFAATAALKTERFSSHDKADLIAAFEESFHIIGYPNATEPTKRNLCDAVAIVIGKKLADQIVSRLTTQQNEIDCRG